MLRLGLGRNNPSGLGATRNRPYSHSRGLTSLDLPDLGATRNAKTKDDLFRSSLDHRKLGSAVVIVSYTYLAPI